MPIQKPLDLIRFISGINISSNGRVHLDQLQGSSGFTSELYTPDYSVSVTGRMVHSLLNTPEVELLSDSVEPDSITSMVLNSDLSVYAPDVYLLLRIVVLESFALVYCIEQDRPKLQYMTKRDILRIRENINYIADYFSTQEKYRPMIEKLRDMHISLGYIENQIDVILGRNGVR